MSAAAEAFACDICGATFADGIEAGHHEALRSPAPLRRAEAFDPAVRRRSVRKGRERGCWVYIPGVVLQEAGFPLEAPPFYRTAGYQRSANGHSVIVSLYRER